jgi:hypothetical protein
MTRVTAEPDRAGRPGGRALLKFSQCMRSHGVSNFPDLGAGAQLQKGQIDTSSPQFQSALQVCQSLLPAGVGPGNG